MGYYITPKTVIVVGSVLPGLASIAVISRFFVRSKQATRYGVDDWLILASLVVLCVSYQITSDLLTLLASSLPLLAVSPWSLVSGLTTSLLRKAQVDVLLQVLR